MCGAVLISHHWGDIASPPSFSQKHLSNQEFPSRKTVSKLVVVLGDHNNEEKDEGEEQRLVDQVVLHPKYSHSNYNNDLALLRLQRPVAFTK